MEFDPKVLERSRFIHGDAMNTSYSLIEPFQPRFLSSKWKKLEKRTLIKDHAVLAKSMLDHYFAHGDAERKRSSRPSKGSLHYIETHIINDPESQGFRGSRNCQISPRRAQRRNRTTLKQKIFLIKFCDERGKFHLLLGFFMVRQTLYVKTNHKK